MVIGGERGMAKKLMKGAEAIGEAAVRAGAEAYFCYPITPQTEVAEYLARRMPEAGGVFLQAESEVGKGSRFHLTVLLDKQLAT